MAHSCCKGQEAHFCQAAGHVGVGICSPRLRVQGALGILHNGAPVGSLVAILLQPVFQFYDLALAVLVKSKAMA